MYWEYDARKGVRWNQDPITKSYESPYDCHTNNPIRFNDPNGMTPKDIIIKDLKGRELFRLDDGKKENTIKTTRQIYNEGIQWFEPEAKNYMELLSVNRNIGKIEGIKHFSWDDIINYADNNQSLLGYVYTGYFSDWKSNSEGADGFPSFTQNNLRKRVSSVVYQKVYHSDASQGYAHATHYSYDIHGNVNELVQDNPEMAVTSSLSDQRYKRLEYDYDLISGKVNRVSYQRGARDAWHHWYEYDADNRITQVYTSTHPDPIAMAGTTITDPTVVGALWEQDS